MGKKDPRVDAYIDHSADFAKPILKHIRKLIHSACPSVEESVKWRMPFFEHKGIICMMAAFKSYCALRFWHPEMRRSFRSENSMSHFGRITKLADLPTDAQLLQHLRRAVELNKSGIKSPRIRQPREKLKIPSYVVKALKGNKKAKEAFEKFSYSHQKEYVQWISDAKREETRAKRIATMLQWLVAGKSRNWKYEA